MAVLKTKATENQLDSASAVCIHCGLSYSSVNRSGFCCHGCETVYQVLKTSGLAHFYDLKVLNPPACPVPAQVSSESFSFCDDSEVIGRFSRKENELVFFIEGLNCSACLWLIERLPEFCPDVLLAEVNYSQSTVRVVRHASGSFAAAARALNKIGYRPRLFDAAETSQPLLDKERRADLRRIGIAGFCAGNIMIFSVSIYAGASGLLATQFAWVTAALALPVLTYSAWPFYKSAIGSLRVFKLNLDVPIVAAIWAGLGLSLSSLVFSRTAPPVYFDSLSVLVLLLLSSRFLLKSMHRRHLDTSNLEDLLLLGTVERRTLDGRHELVSNFSVRVGDRLVIEGDSVIPADGIVCAGSGLIQTSAITGESTPVEIRTGDLVFAGTANLSGDWLLQVTSPAKVSRLATLLHQADLSSKQKTNLSKLADQVGSWFVGLVLVFALGVCVYFFRSQPEIGFSRALAFVIVTCPCVFGMAIPLSLSLAVKAAASRGIVIKDGDVIERLWSIQKVIFDKTGTLTTGQVVVTNFACVGASLVESVSLLLALEKDETHPVAHALRHRFSGLHSPLLVATNVHRGRGGGIEGAVNGELYFVKPLGLARGAEQARTLVSEYGLYRDSILIARFEIGDQLRPEAKDVVTGLQSQKLRVEILSGDRRNLVEKVGAQLGVAPSEIVADASPEEKTKYLEDLGPACMMIGDGANDAAALATAGVGVAIRGSVDVSLRAADVYLMSGDLESVADLFEIARSTRRAIRRNLAFSAGFNSLAGAIALSGHMQPLWAAVFMPLSSLTVLGSSIWTGRHLSKKRITKQKAEG